jgi:probable addiction module antidote protein
MPTLDYRAHLLEDLKNPEYAAGYLTAALEEGEDVFLLAVRDVVDAHGGIGRLSESTSLNRENLHQILSQRGNPRLSSLMSILRELGVEIQFRAKPCDMTAALITSDRFTQPASFRFVPDASPHDSNLSQRRLPPATQRGACDLLTSVASSSRAPRWVAVKRGLGQSAGSLVLDQL